MSTLQRTYRFRMCPSWEQEQSLFRMAGARRFVWNWALARRKEYYAANGKGIPASQLSRELTELKRLPETAWLRMIDSQLVQQSLADLDKAFNAFFERRSRYPRFKSKKADQPRFRIPQRVKVVDGRVYVPKTGWIHIRQSQAVEGETKSATFKQDACGNWHVTLVVNFEMPDTRLPMPQESKVAGIDAGLKDFAVLSNGERVKSPGFFRKAERKLRKAQRVLCRRRKGSNRRRKAGKRIARVHLKIANQRKDFLHKLSTNIIKRFDGVCVEDLNVKGLAKSKLAKSINDAAHGEFRRQLEYKAIWNCKSFVAIDRFFPSSKLCCGCGAINDGLTLADREWACGCGEVHDRDINAARNIKDEGFRLFAVGHTEKANARRGGVRPLHQRQSPLKRESPGFSRGECQAPAAVIV
jgi:putative transposase